MFSLLLVMYAPLSSKDHSGGCCISVPTVILREVCSLAPPIAFVVHQHKLFGPVVFNKFQKLLVTEIYYLFSNWNITCPKIWQHITHHYTVSNWSYKCSA